MRRGEIFEEWQKGVVAWLCTEMNDAELAEFCREKFGIERTNSDGYTLVKVSDKGGQWERWAFKSRVVWERANGKIPAGMCIVHIDGDKANDDLRNLRLVNRATMQRTVKMGGLCFGREINTAILSLCEMEVKLKNVK